MHVAKYIMRYQTNNIMLGLTFIELYSQSGKEG